MALQSLLLLYRRYLSSTHISAITPISTGAYKPVSMVLVYYDNMEVKRDSDFHKGCMCILLWCLAIELYIIQGVSSLRSLSPCSYVCGGV